MSQPFFMPLRNSYLMFILQILCQSSWNNKPSNITGLDVKSLHLHSNLTFGSVNIFTPNAFLQRNAYSDTIFKTECRHEKGSTIQELDVSRKLEIEQLEGRRQ